MAQFPHFAEGELRSALAQRRLALVVGQRRSGVSHWLLNAQMGTSIIDRIIIDLAGIRFGAAPLARLLAERLQLERVPVAPGDLMPLLIGTSEAMGKPIGVLLGNGHAVADEAIDWLLQGLLNPVVDPSQSRYSFCVEGAIDATAWLERCATIGATESPLVVYEAPSSPWQRIVDAERAIAARQRQLPSVLVALLADICDGDMVLLHDIVERLPEVDFLSGAVLDSALKLAGAQGRCAQQLRAALSKMDPEQQALAARLAAGEFVVAPPPSSLGDPVVKSLYLSGLASFDPVVCAYRVRGYLAARLLEAGGRRRDSTETHGQTACLAWQVATVEYSLRSRVRSHDVIRAASEVSAPSQWEPFVRTTKKALASSGMSSTDLARVDKAMKDAEGAKKTVLDLATQRLGLARTPTIDELLEGVTFDELVAIATKIGVVGEGLRAALDGVRRVRNAVAHLRKLSLDEVLVFSREVRIAVQSLVRHDEPAAGR